MLKDQILGILTIEPDISLVFLVERYISWIRASLWVHTGPAIDREKLRLTRSRIFGQIFHVKSRPNSVYFQKFILTNSPYHRVAGKGSQFEIQF